MLKHGNIVIAGEDVGRKGGVYGVTLKLQQRFGADRVIDTLLDEQSILGLGIGLAHNNLLPIPEIQFLAYLHNAEDQLRGEAATLSFFSNRQYTNPMIVRIAGLGYQRGFGGHFHNDNSIAVLRDIPGIVIACPSNGRDAVAMMRECVRLALEGAAGDRISGAYRPLHDPGSERTRGQGLDIRLRSARRGIGRRARRGACRGPGHGIWRSSPTATVTTCPRQAQKRLREDYGVEARVIDMRWLAPLPEEAILTAVADCPRVLIVDECRRTGSQSESLMAMFAERRPGIRAARVTADDSFIPIGLASTLTLPSRESIIARALECVGSRPAGHV